MRSLLLALIYIYASASAAHAVLVDKVVATVNSEVILESDIKQFERTFFLRTQLDPVLGFDEELAKQKLTRPVIIHFLIQEHLIAQQYKVSEAEVDQEIQNIMHNNNLGDPELKSFLKSKGYSYDDYRALIRISVQKRNLLNSEIRSRVNITEEDRRNYFYNLAMKDASIPLEYSIQLIEVSFKTYKNQPAARQVAEEALKAIQEGGEAFTDVAKRTSDSASAGDGGSLGYVSSDVLAPQLQTTVKRLKIGEVSDVIRGQDKFFIMKLIDVRSAENQKYLEKRDEIGEKLAKKEYQRQINNYSERLQNNAYVKINE